MKRSVGFVRDKFQQDFQCDDGDCGEHNQIGALYESKLACNFSYPFTVKGDL